MKRTHSLSSFTTASIRVSKFSCLFRASDGASGSFPFVPTTLGGGNKRKKIHLFYFSRATSPFMKSIDGRGWKGATDIDSSCSA